VSLLPIAAISWSGQVLSRSSSRVRSPGSSTGAVALRSQTALTGSDWLRTIRQREQGQPTCTGETCCALNGPYFVFRASRPALVRPEWSVSESDGQDAEAAARAARRAALKQYRKFSHNTPGRRDNSGKTRARHLHIGAPLPCGKADREGHLVCAPGSHTRDVRGSINAHTI